MWLLWGKKVTEVTLTVEEYEKLKEKKPRSTKPWWSAPGDKGWLWIAPEYFSRWRIFPRIFISMYIYLLYEVTTWFMALPDPNTQQAGLVSVVVGAGAAWFGLYVNSTSTDHA